MKKYYEIENLDESFETIDEAVRFLEKILYDEANYNYNANKDNTYSLLETVYYEDDDRYDSYEILPTISVKEFKDMDFEKKERYFKKEEK